MRPLQMNLLPPALVPVWLVCAFGFSAVGLLLLSVTLIVNHRGVRAMQERMSAAQMERQHVSLGVEPESTRRSVAYALDARRAVKEAQFAAAQSLTALERAGVTRVVLTSVELQGEEGLVKAELSFVDYPTLQAAIAEMNAGESPVRWRLVRASLGTGAQSNGTAVLESTW